MSIQRKHNYEHLLPENKRKETENSEDIHIKKIIFNVKQDLCANNKQKDFYHLIKMEETTTAKKQKEEIFKLRKRKET